MPRKKKPSSVVLHRAREIEPLLAQGTPTPLIYAYAKREWGAAPRTTDKYIRLAKDLWSDRVVSDPERARLREEGLASLRLARFRLHAIMADHKETGLTRVAAAGKLATLERTMLRVAGIDNTPYISVTAAGDVDASQHTTVQVAVQGDLKLVQEQRAFSAYLAALVPPPEPATQG